MVRRRVRALSAWLATPAGELLVLALLLLAAFVTRFYAIGKESLWHDEVITFHRSSLKLSELIPDAEGHHHNPFYFMLMHAWLKLGDDELMMRAPSAIFGALTIPVGYLIGRIAGGRWVATAGAVALLLNPRLIAYAQEARMYALYVFGASLSMAGLVWLLVHPAESLHPLLALRRGEKQRPGRHATLAWVGCTFGWVLSLYCHATAALFVLACSVVALLRIAVVPENRWRFVASWTVANLLAILVFLPWVFRLGRQVEHFKDDFWAVFPTGARVVTELGPTFLYGPPPWHWLVVGALALAGSYALRHHRLVLASLWLLAVLGPGLVLLVSLWQPMFMHRQFLWAAVPFGVLVGAGLTAPSLPAARGAVLAVGLLLGGWRLNAEYYAPLRKERWRSALEFLDGRARQGTTVVAGSYSVKLLFEYHFGRKTAPIRRIPYKDKRGVAALSKVALRRGIWVVTRSGDRWSPSTPALNGMKRVEVKSLGKGVDASYYRLESRRDR